MTKRKKKGYRSMIYEQIIEDKCSVSVPATWNFMNLHGKSPTKKLWEKPHQKGPCPNLSKLIFALILLLVMGFKPVYFHGYHYITTFFIGLEVEHVLTNQMNEKDRMGT